MQKGDAATAYLLFAFCLFCFVLVPSNPSAFRD